MATYSGLIRYTGNGREGVRRFGYHFPHGGSPVWVNGLRPSCVATLKGLNCELGSGDSAGKPEAAAPAPAAPPKPKTTKRSSSGKGTK